MDRYDLSKRFCLQASRRFSFRKKKHGRCVNTNRRGEHHLFKIPFYASVTALLPKLGLEQEHCQTRQTSGFGICVLQLIVNVQSGYIMEDIENHVAESAARIKTANRKLEDRGNAMYQHAQLLVSVCRHEESLPFFEDAMKILSTYKSDFVWKRTFCSLGLQFATALDFLGNYDKAGEVFKVIVEFEPQGYHIGDYALFLHRRKREFDKAQG